MAKIVLTGNPQHTAKNAAWIQEALKDYQVQIFPAMIPGPQGPTINIIFVIPSGLWENPTKSELFPILQKISEVAPIQVNAESFI
jgi:hypothetical protein